MSEAGMKVRDVVYPMPDKFSFGDTVLVCEVTGLDFHDFLDKLDRPTMRDDGDGNLFPAYDPRVLAGMLVVAYKRKVRCPDKQALAFVRSLDIAALDFEGDSDLEVDDRPPATSPVSENATPANGHSLSPASKPSEEQDTSAELIQLPSGGPGSATTSPPSDQTAHTA